MTDDTPSTDEQKATPGSDDISNFAPSAPSDFLTHLPPSSEKVFTDQDGSTPASTDNTHGGPPKLQVDSQGRTLNPRSCVTCRKRKVKCDKTHPCSNCNRAHIECVFPSPGRAPRKVRKLGEGRDKELLERLRRLEGVVKGMGVEVPPDEKGGNKDSQTQVDPKAWAGHGEPLPDVCDQGDGSTKVGFGANSAEGIRDAGKSERMNWVEEQQQSRFENRFGRLVINEGKSRYINNSFWANLSNEVEDLKGILNQSSDEEEDFDASPSSNAHPGGPQHGWVFGFSSHNVDLLSLHPLPNQIQEYWELYKDRVDPLVKVLHIPTIEPTVLSAASHLSNLSKGFEVLLFAIYYGATTTLSPADCTVKFGEDRQVLLSRYRFGLEQALARASFLTTEETIVLQAFVIFLICLRRNNDARVIWTLTGLVVRIAQTLGVHRDGSHFGLSPFEIEMRRRLWWQVCILDTRASEDHGCDPTILEQAFDTKMPLNINDVDITPDMKEFPPERQGCTDISFCLIRFEVANTFRRINYIPPGPPRACQDHFANVTLQDKEKWITECHQRLEERYLKHCDMSVPLFWVTATVARLMMSKMWLMVYHPFQRQDGGVSLPNETKEKLFITSLENIEYSILLETEARTMKWGWLFKTYMQWHALAFILSELCTRTSGELVERAWSAVEKTRDGRWGMQISEDTRAGHLWRPLKKLYRKAREARQLGLQEESLTKQKPLPPQRTYSPNANPMFEHPPRPRTTRAPLSNAQLQRFANGPSYGEMPVDKHELFKSPKLVEAVGKDEIDPMDSISLPSQSGQLFTPEASGQDAQAQQLLNNNDLATTFNGPNPLSQANLDYSISRAPGNFVNPTAEPTDMSDLNYLNNNFNHMPGYQPPWAAPDDPARMNSFDSNGGLELRDLDVGVMDTTGDLNWENWDQLVKQFGMDVDQVPAGAGVAADWAGSNWNNITNSRMNMGMGSSDWF